MEKNVTEIVMHLVLQLGIILLFAKIFGEITEKYLKQPSVLGELVAGMVIGPFALGSHIHIPHIGALFPILKGEAATNIPVSVELWSIAQIASIILLFMAGLETDMNQFFRYGAPATFIAVGGVIFPFVFGAATTMFFRKVGFSDISSLFMGAIMTATSVGITARVLSDLKSLNTPEGVTILAGAVVDDVLGILVLAIVVSIAKSGEVSLSKVAVIGAKAVGFWLALTAFGILVADKISNFLNSFSSAGAKLALAMFFCFFASALAEWFGLAMIIGAYVMGLALSSTDIAHDLEQSLYGVYHIFVPIFFVVMGMLVNFEAMKGAIIFGVIISVLAIIGKVLGCGIPALIVGFNQLGATRIGIGMLPRGEVALIVAGVGLASGAIDMQIYGVSIMMTFITTLLAPIFLVPLFKIPKSGKRKE